MPLDHNFSANESGAVEEDVLGVGVGVEVVVGDGFGAGIGVGLGVGVGVAEGGVGVGVFVSTPLSQTIFFPVLIQVNFFPLKIFVIPILLQAEPALGGVAAKVGKWGAQISRATNKARRFIN